MRISARRKIEIKVCWPRPREAEAAAGIQSIRPRFTTVYTSSCDRLRGRYRGVIVH